MNNDSLLGHGATTLAFDVGGTNIKAAIIDSSGKVHGLRRIPAPHAGEDAPTRLIAKLVEVKEVLAAEFPKIIPTVVGLIVPGLVDIARGVGVFSSNLGWKNAPIRDLAEQALNLPVIFGHDVQAAGWAEYTFGAACDYDDVVVVMAGTGVAGALILEGRPRLAGGYSCEIGHTPVADDPLCHCGARGCLELYAGAAGMERRYVELSGTLETSMPEVRMGVQRMRELMQVGDQAALQVWNDAIDGFAVAFAQLAAMVAPQAIVIGGGLSQAGEDLFQPLRERLDNRLSFHYRPKILPATLGADAGLLGAALIARGQENDT